MKAMFQFNQTTISSFLNQPAILPLFSSSNDRNQAQSYLSFIGTVEQVWEDGFYLNTGNRTLEVDSWDLYRDSTQRYVSVGQQLTVTGEFDNGEFDAFSITLASSGGGNGSIGNNGRVDSM